MNSRKSIVGAVSVAAVAFVAGRLSLSVDDASMALAQSQSKERDKHAGHDHAGHDHQGMGEMNAEMQAWMEAGTPGKHHEYLNTLVGTFDVDVKMWMEPGAEPMTSTGTVTREWIFDGRYLREDIDATSDWGPFKGLGFVGYDNFDGQYEMIWMDSHSTAIMSETGSYNPKTRTLRSHGNHRDPATGRLVYSHGEMDLSNPDRQTYVSYAIDENGTEYKTFQGTFVRRK